MADGTKIEWTDATWNPITGCSVLSAGCTNCYAMKLAGTRMRGHHSREGLTDQTKAGPVWNGQVRFNETWLTQPMQWRKPREVFVNAHGDTFHEAVPDDWIDQLFAVMALAPQHVFQVLTKRSARMRAYFADPATKDRIGAHMTRLKGMGGIVAWPLRNVWLGVSVENQATANQRIPDLLACPAAVRWISAEPLLGPVDLRTLHLPDSQDVDCANVKLDALTGYHCGTPRLTGRAVPSLPPQLDGLDWVVAGGESDKGQRARAMHPDWPRQLHDQCAAAGVAFLFKQWGDWIATPDGSRCIGADGRNMPNLEPNGTNGDDTVRIERVGKVRAGRVLDGRTHDDRPKYERGIAW